MLNFRNLDAPGECMKILIGYFGIIRDGSITIPSIVRNILNPATKIGDVYSVAHLYEMSEVVNKRSGERGLPNIGPIGELRLDDLVLEKPGDCLENFPLDDVKLRGDAYQDNFRSIENLCHQLNSLKFLNNKIKTIKPDIVLAVRPDLYYHDSLESAIIGLLKSSKPMCMVPSWQYWGGLNDRFSISNYEGSLAYTGRGEQISSYLDFFKFGGLGPEKLLHYSLRTANVRIRFTNARATRVRVGGQFFNETFNVLNGMEPMKIISTELMLARRYIAKKLLC